MFLSFETAVAFAKKRNPILSFPFLKENGELLSIAMNSNALVEPRVLDLYADFYSHCLQFTKLYPQFYRFTLGMAADLEKAGMKGCESRKIFEYIKDLRLLYFDTSDTRKLETLTMFQHQAPLNAEDTDLHLSIIRRIDKLISNPEWFTKFNKPLFYELTHIIFFLTDYGNQALPLQNDALRCLKYMGVLCLLDNDGDLLAEVCICLNYMNVSVPEYWDKFLKDSLDQVRITYDGTVASTLNPAVDEYHMFFVLNWYQAIQGRPSFQTKFNGRIPSFSIPDTSESLLSKLSNYVHKCHFSQPPKERRLEDFLSTLCEREIMKWSNIIKSTEESKKVVSNYFK